MTATQLYYVTKRPDFVTEMYRRANPTDLVPVVNSRYCDHWKTLQIGEGCVDVNGSEDAKKLILFIYKFEVLVIEFRLVGELSAVPFLKERPLVNRNDNHNKWWQLYYDNDGMWTKYGKIGAKTMTSKKKYMSPRDMHKLTQSKMSKGYTVVDLLRA